MTWFLEKTFLLKTREETWYKNDYAELLNLIEEKDKIPF